MSAKQDALRLDQPLGAASHTDSAPARTRTRPAIISRIARANRQNPIGALSILLLVLIVGVILLGPILPVPDPQAPSLADRLQSPLSRGNDETLHILGTDQLGRDVMSRTLYGGRISLGIALAAVIVSGIAGTVLGLIAGYRGGVFDYAVMRLVDFQMAMPSLLLAIFLIYLLGPSLTNLVILLAILSWSSYTRLVRSDTLGLRSAAFVDAAVVCGAGQPRIIGKHIFPQVAPVLSVIAVFDFSAVILAEAGISFLGFGVQPPQTSWGRMISEGQQFITTGAWWLFAAPGVSIILTVLCVRLGSTWVGYLLGTRDSTLT
jgi:peptide/nickel transport system permease protein